MHKVRVDQLKIGQRCDLEADAFADAAYFQAAEAGVSNPEELSDHPEFQFEFQVVTGIERESPECWRVDFDNVSFGFPPDHEVAVDPEQTPEEFPS